MGRAGDMLDLGPMRKMANGTLLHQYAVMGSYYAENVRGIQKPRVGLLNNGTEASKGDPLRKETYQLLSEDESIHFVGNVEARDLMDGVADVVVADGFTGKRCPENDGRNCLGILKQLKLSLVTTGNWKAKLGAFFLLKDRLKSLKQTLEIFRCWRSGLVWSSSTCC